MPRKYRYDALVPERTWRPAETGPRDDRPTVEEGLAAWFEAYAEPAGAEEPPRPAPDLRLM